MADVNINKFRASVVRDGSKPASPGFIVSEGQDPVNPPGTNNYVPYSGATANVELGEYGVEAGFITLDTTPTNTPTDQGTIFWDADDETVDIVLNGYTMKIGEDLFYPVKNQTGSTIAKGVAVRFNGTVGASGRLLIAPFIADGSVPSTRFMGVTAEEILNGEDGKVLYFGRVRGINTNAFNEGDILYASTTVAGGYQTAIPVAPNNIVQVAAVVTKSATVGTIFVRPTLGSNINTDEGVKIVSVADKNLLQYQSGTSLWENKSLAQVLGGTSSQFVKGDGSLDSTSYGTGTVTSVGLSSATSGVTIGSSPVTTSGTITLAIATASGSQNGLLSSTDWTTFNNKQNALTNPVTGTGTTNYLPKFTGSTTIGNSIVYDDGAVGIGTLSATAINNASGIANLVVGNGGSSPQGITIYTNSSTYGGLNFADATTGGGAYAGYIKFDHTNDSMGFFIGNTPRVTIFSDGNTFIGSSPSNNGARLQVSGTATISSNIAIGGTITSLSDTDELSIFAGTTIVDNRARIELYGPSHATLANQTIVRGSQITFTSSAAATQYMTITSSGSVGIGTTSPVKTLDVRGTLAISNSALSFWYMDRDDSDGRFKIVDDSNNDRFNITTSGNVGIGTASVSTAGAGFTALEIKSSVSGANIVLTNVNGHQTYLYTGSTSSDFLIENAGSQIFRPGNTERMRITSSGNVGLGVTPSAWASAYAVMQYKGGFVGSSANSFMYYGQNAYSDGSFKYVANGYAGIYAQDGGDHIFYTAPSGTAGNAITFTPRMTIKSGGNVLIGTSTDSGSKLHVSGSATIVGPALPMAIASTNATELYCEYRYNTSTVVGYIGNGTGLMTGGGDANFGIRAQNSLVFSTLTTERMRITSAGIVDIAGPLVVRGTLPADQTDAAVIDHFSNTMRIFSYGAAGVTGDFQFRTAAGGAGSNLVSTINGTTGAYTAVSDINKKKDFEESTIGLNAILGLKPTLYRMKTESNTQKHLGFIAQEVRQYIPNAYVENGEFIGLNEMPIIAALTKAIQELKQEIDTLKN